MLSACSSWFERVLSSVEEYQHPIIILDEVSHAELGYLVNFMYSGEAVVPHHHVQSFLRAAEMLEIKGLLESRSRSKSYSSQFIIDSSKEVATIEQSTKFKTEKSLNLVKYNKINMNTLKSNPLIKAYEANNKRKSENSKKQESKKSLRYYEGAAPVLDNRNLLSLLQFQHHSENSDYEGDNLEEPAPASGVEDCGPYKKVWSTRYLCYNLGKEILCLLCFCRFTQFKKFNLDRHMRNKHSSLYFTDENTKKRLLDIVSSKP